jgi:YHS domain-containing protein
VRAFGSHKLQPGNKHLRRREVKKMAKDLVCGMEVDEKKAAAEKKYQGKTYYFCSKSCSAKFSEDPDKFVKKAKN